MPEEQTPRPQPSYLTISEMIQAIKRDSGNQDLWSEFFDRFGYLVRSQMRLYARDLMHEYESDLFQEACLRVICEFDRLQPDREGLQTYIQMIVRSAIEDFRRHNQQLNREDSGLSVVTEFKRAKDSTLLVDLWTDICKYFPAREDRLIVRQIWEEATIPQIQRVLGVTEYQVKKVRARLTNVLSRLI